MKEVYYGHVHSGKKQASRSLRGKKNVYSQVGDGICRASVDDKKYLIRQKSEPRGCYAENALRRAGNKHSGVF